MPCARRATTTTRLAPLRRSGAEPGAPSTRRRCSSSWSTNPDLGKLLPVVLYETLGPTLTTPDGVDAAGAAAVWGLAQQAAGFWDASIRRGRRSDGGDAARRRAVRRTSSPTRPGIVFSIDDYDETMKRLLTPDGKDQPRHPRRCSRSSTGSPPSRHRSPPTTTYPFVLAAGERRSSTANTIYRDPSWRKKDQQGALRISPGDAAALGLADGDRARVTTKRGDGVAVVEVTDTMRDGHVSLPNGFGLDAWPATADSVGVAPNELTSTDDRDWFAGTPFHKHVRARVERSRRGRR